MDLTSVDLSSPWAYGALIGFALVDGIVPLVPARTAVIGIGVLAGTGDARAYPLLVLATAAAFISDNISYWIGSRFWRPISRALFAGARARRAWGWVERQMEQHGAALVALARVLPGGPTPITLTAGSMKMPIGRFRRAAAVSAGLWSVYAFGIGLAGDAIVGDNLLIAFIVALALGGALNLALRAGMRRRQRRIAGPCEPTPRASADQDAQAASSTNQTASAAPPPAGRTWPPVPPGEEALSSVSGPRGHRRT